MTAIAPSAAFEEEIPRDLAAIIRRFTPNWFAVVMGTGGLALVLHRAPGAPPALDALAAGLWMAAGGLFALFSALYAARWILYPREARRIFAHPVMSMFLGTIPMALATVANGFVVFGPSLIGPEAIAIAHVLWWIDAALAVVCGLAVPFLMFTRQEHRAERMTAAWLLPLVAAEVTAAGAGVIAPHLPPAQATVLVAAGYMLWAYSVPLAMGVLVLLFQRLALHKLPEREAGASGWLALGPIGTGALGLLLLGESARDLFAGGPLEGVGETAFGLGVIGGLMLWGLGAWWLGLALLKTLSYRRGGLPFNLSWWAFIFPVAVHALAAFALAEATGFRAFAHAGAALAVGLTAAWAVVAGRTLAGAWRRTLFVAPCLRGL